MKIEKEQFNKQTKWTPASKLPELFEAWPGAETSDDLLFTNGEEIFIGYVKVLYDNDGHVKNTFWVISNSDGKAVNNVIHWMSLPTLPDYQRIKTFWKMNN